MAGDTQADADGTGLVVYELIERGRTTRAWPEGPTVSHGLFRTEDGANRRAALIRDPEILEVLRRPVAW